MKKINIRALSPQESGSAKQFLKNVWHELFSSSPDPFVRNYFSDPVTLKDLDDIVQTYFNNKGIFLVATDESGIIGTGAVIKVDEEICELCRMFVRSDHRRQGIAKQLSNALLDFAKQNGYKKIKLGSNRQLIASHHLYKKLGFEEIKPATEEDGKYAIFMEKSL